MVWQDIAITIIQAALVLPLIPSLYGAHKPPISTSLGTGVLLASLAIVFSTLSLWFATMSTAAVAILWMVLAWQEWQLQKHENKHS